MHRSIPAEEKPTGREGAPDAAGAAEGARGGGARRDLAVKHRDAGAVHRGGEGLLEEPPAAPVEELDLEAGVSPHDKDLPLGEEHASRFRKASNDSDQKAVHANCEGDGQGQHGTGA